MSRQPDTASVDAPMWMDVIRHGGGRPSVPDGTGGRSRRRRLLAVALGTLCALGVVIAGPAGPAYAHAQLTGTSPANGARLDSPPTEIVLRFTEPVSPVRDAVRLFDSTGKVRNTRPARTDPATPERVVLPVPAGLGTGTYTVSWRVVSADSHPVYGAFVFGIGEAPANGPSGTGVRTDNDTSLTVVFWLFRWLGYVALALFAGVVAFLFLCWPGGWTRARVRRLVAYGWGGGMLSALGVLLLQGAYAGGASLAAVADPSLLGDTLSSGYGRWVLARIALLGAAGAVAFARLRRPARSNVDGRPSRARIAVAALSAALPVTWAGTGHPNATGSALAAAADAAHLAAMAVWFGGLVVLLSTVLAASASVPRIETARAVARFSPIAAGCIGVLAVTGGYQAWRGVGSLAALAGSAYGELLVFKLALVGVLLLLGAMSRSVVQRRYVRPALRAAAAESGTSAPPAPQKVAVAAGSAGRRGASAAGGRVEGGRAPGPRPAAGNRGVRKAGRADREQDQQARRQLRWSVRIEVIVGLAVLGLTSMLVATPPAARPAAPPAAVGAAAVPEVAVAELALTGGGRVTVRLEPARVGATALTVTVRDAAGRPWDVPEVSAAFRLDARGVGPLPASLDRAGPGEYATRSLTLPLSGTWQLQLTIRTSDFDELTAATDITVG